MDAGTTQLSRLRARLLPRGFKTSHGQTGLQHSRKLRGCIAAAAAVVPLVQCKKNTGTQHLKSCHKRIRVPVRLSAAATAPRCCVRVAIRVDLSAGEKQHVSTAAPPLLWYSRKSPTERRASANQAQSCTCSVPLTYDRNKPLYRRRTNFHRHPKLFACVPQFLELFLYPALSYARRHGWWSPRNGSTASLALDSPCSFGA